MVWFVLFGLNIFFCSFISSIPKSGIDLKTESFVDKITVYRGINPDETPANLAVITIDESDEARHIREDSGEEPGFSIEGEELEKLISALAKIV